MPQARAARHRPIPPAVQCSLPGAASAGLAGGESTRAGQGALERARHRPRVGEPFSAGEGLPERANAAPAAQLLLPPGPAPAPLQTRLRPSPAPSGHHSALVSCSFSTVKKDQHLGKIPHMLIR